jgi:hypothetical protein
MPDGLEQHHSEANAQLIIWFQLVKIWVTCFLSKSANDIHATVRFAVVVWLALLPPMI